MDTTLELIPTNTEGKPSDLTYPVTLPDQETAETSFRRAVKRLLNPSAWHKLAGWASAHFVPVTAEGTPIHRLIRKGDYLRIDIPGPGPRSGEGYDWVRVEMLEDGCQKGAEREWLALQLRPCAEPGKDETVAAHFFTGDATSTYIVSRIANTVMVAYHGRNEVPNTDTGNSIDNIRNAVIATGAALSFSEVQWSALCKGLLSEEIGGKSEGRKV